MSAPAIHGSMWDVPAQERAVALLRSAVERGEVTHAWAFIGPAGVGQEQASRALAAALNCPQPDPPCGACPTCLRCARGAYPDYWEFTPTGAMHRVADVREGWLPVAARTAAEGDWKVLRIIDADHMNEAAANAFLKGLEEPPPRTVWILDVADPDELPDTILSRCREVRFVGWGPAELEAEAVRLGMEDGAERVVAVRSSLGAPAILRRLAAAGGLADLRVHRAIPARLRIDGPGYAVVAARALGEEVKRRTAAIQREGQEELEAVAAEYSGEPPRAVARQVEERTTRREREARTGVVQAALDDLLGWYRDCLVVASGGQPDDVIHVDAVDALAADAEALGPAGLLEAVDRVLMVREDLELNVNVPLALEALFLELSALTRR